MGNNIPNPETRDPSFEHRHPFEKELKELINRHCIENGSDTPDFMLAEYLCDCLSVYEETIAKREKWYGRARKYVIPQPTLPTPNAVKEKNE